MPLLQVSGRDRGGPGRPAPAIGAAVPRRRHDARRGHGPRRKTGAVRQAGP